MKQAARHQGFTLIELSIVLVIVGLIVGGVLVGQDLIRAAEGRAVLAQIEKFNTAVNTFRGKYDCLPGDCTTATQYWGAANSDPTTCLQTVGTGTQTCNGDGDGQIGYCDSEMFRFWQHLANAGLIAGRFDGVDGFYAPGGWPDYCHSSISGPFQNIPSGPMLGTGFAVSWYPYWNPAFKNVSGLKHVYMFGIPNYVPTFPVFTAAETMRIDLKVDDGLPSSGNIITMSASYSPQCSTSDSPNATYMLNSTGLACSLIVGAQF